MWSMSVAWQAPPHWSGADKQKCYVCIWGWFCFRCGDCKQKCYAKLAKFRSLCHVLTQHFAFLKSQAPSFTTNVATSVSLFAASLFCNLRHFRAGGKARQQHLLSFSITLLSTSLVVIQHSKMSEHFSVSHILCNLNCPNLRQYVWNMH